MGTDRDPPYTAESIQVLEGLEAVRKRPGMFLGNVADGSGLHAAFQELLDNAVNEHRAGFGAHLRVTLHADGSASVEDEGRGIPVETLPGGVTAAEVAMTRLHGVGVSVVNAVSEVLLLEIRREGKLWRQEYRQGTPQGPLAPVEALPERGPTGTSIRFWPDPAIFSGILRLDPVQIRRRLQELSFLYPALTIELCSPEGHETFHTPGGLASLVASCCGARPVLLPAVASFSVEDRTEQGQPLRAEAALQWVAQGEGERIGFLNGVRFVGGTPFSGACAGVLQAVEGVVRSRRLMPERRSRRSLSASLSTRLVLALRVEHPAPLFGSRTREVLLNKDIGQLLRRELAARLRVFLEEHPDAVCRLVSAELARG
jgi:DNA gyrase subunit B